MPYDERSFLDGLAFGLTATAGRSLGALRKTLMTGTDCIYSTPSGAFDTFVSRVYIQTPFPATVAYEYGPNRNALEREFRRVGASAETQTLYHVTQLPQAVSMANYHYNVYLYERDDMAALASFDARFMAFPYETPAQSWTYPDSPELVRNWWARTYRS